MFAEAARRKFRFPVPSDYSPASKSSCIQPLVFGAPSGLSTEDLWDLTLDQLDSVFMKLDSMRKAAPDESLKGNLSDILDIITAKKAIVRYIFDFKMAEVGTANVREVEANV